MSSCEKGASSVVPTRMLFGEMSTGISVVDTGAETKLTCVNNIVLVKIVHGYQENLDIGLQHLFR